MIVIEIRAHIRVVHVRDDAETLREQPRLRKCGERELSQQLPETRRRERVS